MKKFFISIWKGLSTGVKTLADIVGRIIVMALVFLIWIPVKLLFPLRVKGRKNLKVEGGKVLVSNHFSNLDPFLLYFCFNPFKGVKFLAKKELSKNKLFGWFLKTLGAIFIDRGTTDIKAMKEVSKQLKKGRTVIIFAEGTRNKTEGEDLQELKGGAVFFATSASAQIVPAIILHRPKLFRFNKFIIGEAYAPQRGNREQKQKEVLVLTQKMEELRELAKQVKKNSRQALLVTEETKQTETEQGE